jgi:hypothetical protein
MSTSKVKEIKEFPGYFISKDGRVFSKWKNIGLKGGGFKSIIKGTLRELKPSIRKKGYRYVILRKNGKSYTKGVHRLVAEMFIPNPKKYPFVLHLNDKASNSNVENLMWGTQNMNMQQAKENGCIKKGESRWNYKIKLNEKIIIKVLYRIFGWTQIRLAKSFNISQQHISNIILNKQ